jgi:hypothetical protein
MIVIENSEQTKSPKKLAMHLMQLQHAHKNMRVRMSREARNMGLEETFVDNPALVEQYGRDLKDKHLGSMIGIYRMTERQMIETAYRLRQTVATDIKEFVDRNRGYLSQSSEVIHVYG